MTESSCASGGAISPVPKGIKERDSDIHACEDVGRKEEATVATQVTVSLGAEYALPNITFRPDQP